MIDVTIKNIRIGNEFPVRLMAAVNLSSESFYKKSILNWKKESEISLKFESLNAEGAEILDLGPKSSAPISLYGEVTNISYQKEIERLKVPLKVLYDMNYEFVISIDTQSPEVADYALSNGADIINDISGLKTNKTLAKVIADHSAFVILMACNKNPGDVFTKHSIIDSLQTSKKIALENGIQGNKIIIDPGIGGWVPERTADDDFKIILDSSFIKDSLNSPLLIALSRKSFIGKILNLDPEFRLSGSLSATAISVLNGANIIRTHDVLETARSIKIAEKFLSLIVN